MRPLLLVLLAAPAAAAQVPDTTAPWRYDPVAVGNARTYAQDPSATPYVRTDSPTAVTLDGQRWTVRRTQRYARVEGGGWSRTETRAVVRYDTAEANVTVRTVTDGKVSEAADALYPCRLDLPLTAASGAECAAGVRYVKTGDGRLTFDGPGAGFGVVLEAGVGVVRRLTDRAADAVLVGAVVGGDTLTALPAGFPNARLDPVPAARYVPMSPGDEWHYEDNGGVVRGPQRFLRQIGRPETVQGTEYLTEDMCYETDGRTACTLASIYVRFDTLTARVVRLQPSRFDQPCSFDEPVSGGGGGDIVYCEEEGGIGSAFAVRGGGVVLPSGAAGAVGPFREFVRGGGGDSPCRYADSYAAGLGDVGYECPGLAFVYKRLLYARVRQPDGSVLEVGTPIFTVATEPATRPVLALTAGPNPSAGSVTLRLTMPAGGAVRWEAFDGLGRRVWSRETAEPAGSARLALDVAGWPAGLYVVRATTAGGTATATVVRR